MTIAIIYTRFSPRPDVDQCSSCEKQEERCILHCGKKGYRIVASFPDPDVSGGALRRPGLEAAIERIGTLTRANPTEGKVVLVVDSVDRLARDMLVNLTIRHQVEKAGGRIEYANGTPVNDTPEGKLFSNILAAFAAYERDRVRHATSRGMKKRQANGEWFGKPPVGFMLDPECKTRLIKCPLEQEAIIEAGHLLRNGYSVEQIAIELGILIGLFRGGPWTVKTVKKMLKS